MEAGGHYFFGFSNCSRDALGVFIPPVFKLIILLINNKAKVALLL